MYSNSTPGVQVVQFVKNPEYSHFSRIIFDTAPTGHTLRLLTLPDFLDASLGLTSHFLAYHHCHTSDCGMHIPPPNNCFAPSSLSEDLSGSSLKGELCKVMRM